MAYTRGKGTILQVNNGSFTAIPQARNVTPPPIEMGAVETTHLGSSARERIPTIIDPGQVAFQLEYDPANTLHQFLWTSAQAGDVLSWKVILSDPGACEIAFSGFIMKFGIDQIAVDAVVTIPVTVQVTGLPVISY